VAGACRSTGDSGPRAGDHSFRTRLAAPRTPDPPPALQTRDARSRALVVPTTIHLHGGIGREVVAEWSAGHQALVDGEGSYRVRNMVARLFINKHDVGGRLIRLGCFFSDGNRAGFLGDRFSCAALPPEDHRSPAMAKSDRTACEAIVNLANYSAAFRLDAACSRAVVEQVRHVAERGKHHLVSAVHSAVKNDWQKHSIRATHGGQKTTMKKYAGYIQRFCAWAAERMDADKTQPMSRNVVVDSLEAEAARRLTPARRKRPSPRRTVSTSFGAGERADMGGAGGEETSDGGSSDSLSDARSSDSDGPEPRRRRRATPHGGDSSRAPGGGAVAAGAQGGGARDARVAGTTTATARDGSSTAALWPPQTPERGAPGRRTAAPPHPPTAPANSGSTPPPAGASVVVGSAPSGANLLQGGSVGTAGRRAAPPPGDGSAPRPQGASGTSPSSASGQGRLVSHHVCSGSCPHSRRGIAPSESPAQDVERSKGETTRTPGSQGAERTRTTEVTQTQG